MGSYTYDDFFQEVMIRIVENIKAIRDPRTFPGFFRQVAWSVARDEWRRFQGVPSEVPLSVSLQQSGNT